jgi:hypothetical protein
MTDQKTTLDTRERILDVAEHEFMSHGYEGTSMRMITSKCGGQSCGDQLSLRLEGRLAARGVSPAVGLVEQ